MPIFTALGLSAGAAAAATAGAGALAGGIGGAAGSSSTTTQTSGINLDPASQLELQAQGASMRGLQGFEQLIGRGPGGQDVAEATRQMRLLSQTGGIPGEADIATAQGFCRRHLRCGASNANANSSPNSKPQRTAKPSSADVGLMTRSLEPNSLSNRASRELSWEPSKRALVPSWQ